MGVLYISEYTEGFNPYAPTVGSEPATVQQKVTYGTTTASSAFRTDTKLVRLHNDAVSPCSYRFGPSGTTTTTADARMAANQTEYFKVSPGHVVAAITNT